MPGPPSKITQPTPTQLNLTQQNPNPSQPEQIPYPGISLVSALAVVTSATLAIMEDLPVPGPPSKIRGVSTPMPTI